MTRRLAFVGPLPPPLNGFSSMCAAMLETLRRRMPIEVFDRSPGLTGGPGVQILQFLKPLRYLAMCLRAPSGELYLALSGGLGQVVDLMYVLIARTFRQRIFIHHHSFAYINASSFLNRCFFACVRDEAHIVLSHGMAAALNERYGLDSKKLHVVSNAAFHDSAVREYGAPAQDSAAAPLQIGYLSNITHEKGFVEFFEILARLRHHGTDFRAHIAGPVDSASRAQFENLLGAAANVEYHGAVYGEKKLQFYRQLDVFVFPTKYVNEAEPLVLYEAMDAGAYVIACDRGAIREMLADDAGLVLASADVVDAACKRIRELSDDRSALAMARQISLTRIHQIRAEAKIELERLLNDMLN
jgi:glycosyltransferase involved in cell wall biosynthesis